MGMANGILKRTTTIPVRVNDEINSQKSENIGFVVARDIRDTNNNVVIAERSPVIADVKLKKRKSIGKSGKIKVDLKSVETINGDVIELVGKLKVEPEDQKGKVLGVGLGVGLTILPIMLLYLIKRGNEAVTNSGTIINAQPVMDYEIN